MVYTKTGDAGTTSLVGGIRVSKDDQRLEAYGTIDELNSHIGLLISTTDFDREELLWIQNTLFCIGSYLATDQSQTQLHQKSIVTDAMVVRLEHDIDRIDATLPRLNNFVLPGGSVSSSQCNVCRTVCRRAERRIVSLFSTLHASALGEADPQDTILLKFINRLSDYLFVLGRKMNNIDNIEENFWQNTCHI